MRALVERVAEAEHELVDVAQIRVRLERIRDQLIVHECQPIGRSTRRVYGGIRQNLGAVRRSRRKHEALADTPVVVQQVAEVRDVEADLPGVSLECGDDYLLIR